jgi:hypothetical protein
MSFFSQKFYTFDIENNDILLLSKKIEILFSSIINDTL